jgi:hypothetical protein
MRALLALCVIGLIGCGSEAANPTPPNTFKVDSGVAETEADTGSPDVALDTGTPDANCFGDAGCFACKPATNEQFLNRCPGGGVSCSKFDDKTRIPSSVWDGGALPPVP